MSKNKVPFIFPKGKRKRMNFSNIPKVLWNFLKKKKIWRKPKRARVLIWDREGSDLFLNYLAPQSLEILDLREESVNLYVLFKCFLKFQRSLKSYVYQYLECVKPKVLLTFIDNDISFYKLKDHRPDLTTVFVQNGLRGEVGDVFGELKVSGKVSKKYQVNHMLTFGSSIGLKYLQYIDGQVHPIGSFMNNLFQSKTPKQLRTVLFISSCRTPPNNESKPMFVYKNKPFFWKELVVPEVLLLPFLHKYCLSNRLELKICLSTADPKNEEGNFYQSLVGNETLEVLKKTDLFSSYEKVGSAEFVVYLESTLGLEALARGKRTAAFSIRGQLMGFETTNFGWPLELPDTGPFWTNQATEQEFKRVMDYITMVSDEEWEQTRRRYIPELMEYDPGNTRFLKLMRELGVPLKAEYQKKV